jgi:hypothetical protein
MKTRMSVAGASGGFDGMFMAPLQLFGLTGRLHSSRFPGHHQPNGAGKAPRLGLQNNRLAGENQHGAADRAHILPRTVCPGHLPEAEISQ